MLNGENYPPQYRQKEVQVILAAASAGECGQVLGLSGAGKSNLMSFIVQHGNDPETAGKFTGRIHFVLIDCNRLPGPAAGDLLQTAASSIHSPIDGYGFEALERAVGSFFKEDHRKLCLLIDRFDLFTGSPELPILLSNLRALRDTYKYRLCYVITSRKPIDPHSELAELFYANTIWLGAMSEPDARWNIIRFATRRRLEWGEQEINLLMDISGRYPSFLKAACESLAAGAPPDVDGITRHPGFQRRLEEFFSSQPASEELKVSGLADIPVVKTLHGVKSPQRTEDLTCLTAKEHLLLEYLHRNAEKLCEKDEIIRAVWPEDKIYSEGIRDDSLAQLVRRLREKIENDPSHPELIITVPGRGYMYRSKV